MSSSECAAQASSKGAIQATARLAMGRKRSERSTARKIETDSAAGCWRLETRVYAVMHSLQEREELLRQGSNATKQSTGDERSCRWWVLRSVAPLIGVLEQGGYDVQGGGETRKEQERGASFGPASMGISESWCLTQTGRT